MKKIKQTKCPECGSYQTVKISAKQLLRTMSVMGFLFGGLLVWILIGIPIVFVAILGFILSFLMKESGKTKCKSCGLIFYENKKTSNR